MEAKNLVPGDMVIPELDELADREDFEPWLNLLLQYRYIDQPGGGARMAQGGLLAVDAPATMAPDAKAVREAQRALLELVQRHRDTLQEY
ncbi:MAG: hypothetical protein R3311_20860 [Oceanisphaera sp.]|nr:hypothetical protein [Oceanisphaera sp.]